LAGGRGLPGLGALPSLGRTGGDAFLLAAGGVIGAALRRGGAPAVGLVFGRVGSAVFTGGAVMIQRTILFIIHGDYLLGYSQKRGGAVRAPFVTLIVRGIYVQSVKKFKKLFKYLAPGGAKNAGAPHFAGTPAASAGGCVLP